MKTYTGWQYLMIDVGNTYGLDKEVFETRIKWAEDNLNSLEDFAQDAEDPELYRKACMAVRKAQKGLPTGHRVHLDATTSGAQIMSALTGCKQGAMITNLVDPTVRIDAYTAITDSMNNILAQQGIAVNVSRSDAKEAVMTSLYGSKAIPKKIFGEDTPELMAFYQAMSEELPGAWALLQVFLNAWQSDVLAHEWYLPDGYHARVKILTPREERIEVDELDHATFTYLWYENTTEESGITLPANTVHSVDSYLLRSVIRRCSYDPHVLSLASDAILKELDERKLWMAQQEALDTENPVAKYIERYEATNMADVVILPYLTNGEVAYLTTEHLKALREIIKTMEVHKPFPVLTIHDSFSASPNNLNHVRQHYNNIMAEMADSTILDDILSTIHGTQGTYQKLSNDLSTYIRKAEYPIC